MKFLLKAFLITFTLMQAAQAGRYYNTEQGRFIQRDPLGYVDGMSLYNAYFAERFALDPMGKRIVMDVKEDSLDNIRKKFGANVNAITFTGAGTIRFVGKDDIEEWPRLNGCWCAKVQSAKRGIMTIKMILPNTVFHNGRRVFADAGFVDPDERKAGNPIVNNPLKDIEGHEIERMWVMWKGYYAYIKPSSTDGKYATRCKTVCRPKKGEAKAVLQKYLRQLRYQAKLQYARYEKPEQDLITQENKFWVSNWDNVKLRYWKAKLHNSGMPSEFMPPPCHQDEMY